MLLAVPFVSFFVFFVLPLTSKEDFTSVEFHLLSWDSPQRGLFAVSDDGIVNLVAPRARPSGPFLYKGRHLFQIFREEETDELIPNRILVAQKLISSDLANPKLFILYPNNHEEEENKTSHQILSLPLKENRSQSNKIQIHNLTEYSIGAILNEDSYTLSPRNHLILKNNKEANNNLVLRMALQHEGEWELFFSSIWGNNPNARTIIVIVNDSQSETKVTARRYQIPLARN